MNYGNFTLKVTEKKELAPNIFLVTTKGEGLSNFLAGQYYSFKIADKINRSYSIASAPYQEDVEFVVDIAPGGPGSQFVIDLKKGDEFNALGAFGFFTLEKTKALESESPLIFVATGTGIAPFRSMIIDLLKNKKSQREIKLYFGLRFETDAYFFEEFFQFAEEYPNFEFIPVFSRPKQSWSGAVGHCQDIIKKSPVNAEAFVYVCGRNENVKSITEDLISYGYPKEHVFFEKFG